MKRHALFFILSLVLFCIVFTGISIQLSITYYKIHTHPVEVSVLGMDQIHDDGIPKKYKYTVKYFDTSKTEVNTQFISNIILSKGDHIVLHVLYT
jgi:hypothetical protein